MSLSTTMTAFTPFNNDTLLKTVSSKTSSSLLSLWSGLNAVWQPVMGYKAEDFEFVQGKTAFSTPAEMVGMIALYVVVIFGGREYMRDKKPLELNTLFKIHNFVLSVFSGALLALFLEQLVPTLWKEGFYDTICDSPGWTPQLVTLYYLNYITKYVELIDTVFLMVKKKPLTFLHTYHHPATALLCYTQLTGRTPVSWVPITLNLAVHVIMYWYYFQSARGLKIWWKEWITRFQITQFVIDLFVVYYASWNGLAHKYWPSVPHKGYCGGETYAAASGCLILSSYLVLFILFYIATYKRASKRAASKAVKPNPGAIAIAAQDIVDTAKQSVDAAKASAVGMVNDGMDRNAPLMVEN